MSWGYGAARTLSWMAATYAGLGIMGQALTCAAVFAANIVRTEPVIAIASRAAPKPALHGLHIPRAMEDGRLAAIPTASTNPDPGDTR
ncbi:hypothetical protein GCM10027431_12900 [Lysobacter rhizosphaerae]